MFISHNHNDHILGAIWVIRAIANNMLKGNMKRVLIFIVMKNQ